MLLDLLAGPAGQAWLFLGGHGQGQLLLDQAWRELQKNQPRFHYVPVLMAGADNPWQGKQADPADTLLRHVKQREGALLFLAGFNREVDPMVDKLLAAGFKAEDLKVEKFG
jgi:hypothetical protein